MDGCPREVSDGNVGVMLMGIGTFQTDRVKLPALADMLSRMVDRPVVDMTGDKGTYQVKLNYRPEPGQGIMGMKMASEMRARSGDSAPAEVDDSGPSIFTAVQDQLGLKLEPRKAPMESIVIDRIEKVPTEN